ncbi:hypothetical protein BN1723_017975 [Verticillium longisporum]
MGGSL